MYSELDAQEKYQQDIFKRSKQQKQTLLATLKNQRSLAKGLMEHETFPKALAWPIQLSKF